MTADAFLHQMRRYEQEVQQLPPSLLARVAIEEQKLNLVEAIGREIDNLAKLFKGP